MSVSIEFAKVPELATNWSAGGVDVRRLSAAQMFDSNTADLIQQLSGSSGADFAVIDLGAGDQWLTSRLFIISELLDRMRSLNCFVFVSTGELGRPTFVGIANPQNVRWQLASKYPLLESALIKAYGDILAAWFPGPPNEPARPIIMSSRGALDVNVAAELLRRFLQNIQRPDQPSDRWVNLGDATFEYAEWLTPSVLRTTLGDALQRQAFQDSPDTPELTRVEGILRRPGSFVALVESDQTFRALVDRTALVEKTGSSGKSVGGFSLV